MLAPAVRQLTFERADGQPFAFVPGQFVQIHFHYADGKPTKRSYSVGTVGDGRGAVQRIEIAVSYVDGGAATELLSRIDEGGTLEASGPYGRFCLMDADTNKRYLLVATGTGVTPYRAMLPQMEKLFAARDIQVALVYGARNEAELLYADEFEAFAARCLASRSIPASAARRARCRGRTTATVTRRSRLAELEPECRTRYRLSVRQSGHGRPGLRAAQGSRLAGAAYPPREIRVVALGARRWLVRVPALGRGRLAARAGRAAAVAGRCLDRDRVAAPAVAHEFEQRVELVAIAIAASGVGITSLGWGLLEMDGLVPTLSLFYVLPALVGLYGLAKCVIWICYR